MRPSHATFFPSLSLAVAVASSALRTHAHGSEAESGRAVDSSHAERRRRGRGRSSGATRRRPRTRAGTREGEADLSRLLRFTFGAHAAIVVSRIALVLVARARAVSLSCRAVTAVHCPRLGSGLSLRGLGSQDWTQPLSQRIRTIYDYECRIVEELRQWARLGPEQLRLEPTDRPTDRPTDTLLGLPNQLSLRPHFDRSTLPLCSAPSLSRTGVTVTYKYKTIKRRLGLTA